MTMNAARYLAARESAWQAYRNAASALDASCDAGEITLGQLLVRREAARADLDDALTSARTLL